MTALTKVVRRLASGDQGGFREVFVFDALNGFMVLGTAIAEGIREEVQPPPFRLPCGKGDEVSVRLPPFFNNSVVFLRLVRETSKTSAKKKLNFFQNLNLLLFKERKVDLLEKLPNYIKINISVSGNRGRAHPSNVPSKHFSCPYLP